MSSGRGRSLSMPRRHVEGQEVQRGGCVSSGRGHTRLLEVWLGEVHVGAHVVGTRQVWLGVKLHAGGAPHPLRALALSC